MKMEYKEICEKYLSGDENAIALIDILINSGLNLNYLRNSNDYSTTDEEDSRLFSIDYHDTRAEIDEVIDSLSTFIKQLGLIAPLKHSLVEEVNL